MLLVLIFVLPSFTFADDSVTITTYYPSPFGTYKELKLFPNTSPSTCNASNEGAMYYDDSTNQIRFCNGSAPWQIISTPTPQGAVMFYNLSSCPTGWTELTAGRGRYVVGLPASGTLAGTAGTALSNLENRPVGQHNHPVTDPGHGHTQRGWQQVAGSAYGWNVQTNVGPGYTDYALTTASTTTGFTINNTGNVAGTNAPYIQLLVCQKD